MARDRVNSNDDLTSALSTLLYPGTFDEMETPRVKPPSRRLTEEYLTDDEEDDDEENDDVGSDNEFNVSQESTNKGSAVAEVLLAEDGSENDHKAPPTGMEITTSPQTIFSKLTAEHDTGDDDEIDVTARSDFAAIVNDDEDEVVVRTNALTQVLGPFSGNDTTGVVLEHSEAFDDQSDDEVAAVTSQGPSILKSLSLVVKDAKNCMSYMAGAVSPTNSCSNPDKYLMNPNLKV